MNLFRISLASLILFILGMLLLSPQIPLLSKYNQQANEATGASSLFPNPTPVESFNVAPEISARSAVVIDTKTGKTLYEKDPNIRHLPASTTKLMTAIVALEICEPEKLAQINYVESEPTGMGLQTGDAISTKNLLYGLLINSANDAAYALSYSCADNTEDFVKKTNLKARELGMYDTHFSNPAGFDAPDQFTTARDLAKLSKVAITNPLIAQIVKTQQAVVTDAYNLKTYYLSNINRLLGEVNGIEGVKTGQTEGSGQILVTQTTRDGNTIIVAVLGSSDRFLESKQLIEWTFANHIWVRP